MKIRILNQLLTSERVHGVKFPFPPIAIPASKDGLVSAPDRAEKIHYATIVLLSDEDNAPAILEFSQDTLDGLAAYAQRHHGLSSIEMLLSREEDSAKIRMRVGSTLTAEDDVQILASPYQHIYEGLYNKYLSKLGKKLNDI
jgi:hypothetical protein